MARYVPTTIYFDAYDIIASEGACLKGLDAHAREVARQMREARSRSATQVVSRSMSTLMVALVLATAALRMHPAVPPEVIPSFLH